MFKLSTKDRLLKEATRLFAQNDYKSVTIREISKASNASISMIAYYFGGKDALYSVVLKQQFSCYNDIDEQMMVKANPLAKIRGYIIWSLYKHRKNEHFSKLYIRELISPTKHHATFVKPLLAKSFDYLYSLIEEGKRTAVINPDLDSAAIATMVATTINYVGFYNGIDDKTTGFVEHDVETIATRYMNIIFNGISVDSSNITF